LPAFVSGIQRDRQDEVDVALLCPHLEYDAKRAADQGKLRIPVFVLPMRLYGLVDIENLIEDAEDVLELWKAGTPNVVTFPDEPRSVVAKRTVSHRRWLAQQGK
jgi:PTS system cellobiose-specific IIB component